MCSTSKGHLQTCILILIKLYAWNVALEWIQNYVGWSDIYCLWILVLCVIKFFCFFFFSFNWIYNSWDKAICCCCWLNLWVSFYMKIWSTMNPHYGTFQFLYSIIRTWLILWDSIFGYHYCVVAHCTQLAWMFLVVGSFCGVL